MEKELLKKQNEVNLGLLKTYVPKYDWRLQRVENLQRSLKIDDLGTSEMGKSGFEIKMYYECEFNNTEGQVMIELYEDEDTYGIHSIEVDFKHNTRGYNFFGENTHHIQNHKNVKSNGEEPTKDEYPCVVRSVKRTEEEKWEEIREFFEKYLIPSEERETKELKTRLNSKIKYYLNRTYGYQYDQILLEEIFGNSEYSDLKIYDDYRRDFDKKYDWFGSTMVMITSFLEDKSGDLEYWLENEERKVEEHNKLYGDDK